MLGLNPHRREEDLLGLAQLIAGQIRGAIANALIVQTKRRRAERIWSHARDLMVVLDVEGVFQSVSPAWTRTLGHPIEEIVGQHFERFAIEADMAKT